MCRVFFIRDLPPRFKAKMPGNDAKITVLELVSGTLERDAPTKRLGLWAFCGRSLGTHCSGI